MTNSMDEGLRTDTIIMDVSNAFDLVPQDRLLTKIAAAGLNLRVVVWEKGISVRTFTESSSRHETILRSQSNLRMLQGSALGPPIFLADENDVWRNLESNIRLFADECTIYRKRTDSSDVDKLQMDLNTSGEWEVENESKSRQMLKSRLHKI